ncbi:MAG: hypothetical protein HUJ53_09825, partial [Holdemanella sp.]|nr:hypothetical protein [Holdemanella sp.]
YTVSQCILPDIIEKTNTSDPSIAFYVNESNTKTLEQLLLRNDLDFVITEGNIQNKDIIKVPVANDCLVLVCGRNHPFYGLDKIDIKQLNDENFVLREEGSSTRRTFEDEMINNNINYNIVWECASIEAVKRAIIQNKGMGVISARLIVDEILNGDLHIVKATEVIWKKDIFLCYHKNFKHLRSYQPFIDTTITYQSAGVKCPIVDELVDTSQHEEDMDDKG